jgi:hypothetical protein
MQRVLKCMPHMQRTCDVGWRDDDGKACFGSYVFSSSSRDIEHLYHMPMQKRSITVIADLGILAKFNIVFELGSAV